MIEARHLRVLCAVAQADSFTAAARELGCTQPAVSQQMKTLERSVGTPLLIRAGRGIRLTEAGEVLVRHAGGILAGLRAAQEEVASLAGLDAERVRLVSFRSAASTLVPSALASMRAGWPEIKVSMAESTSPDSIDILRNGDCDIALAFRYPEVPGARSEAAATLAWDDLMVRPLLADPLVALVPENHRLAGARQVKLTDLADEPWAAGCPRCRRHLVDLCRSEGFSPRIDFATDDYPTVIGLVKAGLGVAVLPEMTRRSLPSGTVRALRLEPAAHREVVALTLPASKSVPSVKAMLRELTKAAQDIAVSA
ncbi:LysR family transcriptional regulator [Streptomyces sp. NPDC047082]|uniref:LysR family transcriptional regulator n=1 Tax=Streptomyces sp. NPDC047082 TaxID=3155259 RepID=UPI0033CF364F